MAQMLRKPVFALPGCQQMSVNTLLCDTLGLADLWEFFRKKRRTTGKKALAYGGKGGQHLQLLGPLQGSFGPFGPEIPKKSKKNSRGRSKKVEKKSKKGQKRVKNNLFFDLFSTFFRLFSTLFDPGAERPREPE